jgi:hypothetical protein
MKLFPFYILLILSTGLILSGFNIGTPFRYSKSFNSLPDDAQVIVGITHVTVGKDSVKNKLFWNHTFKVVDSLPSHTGYLGHKIRKQLFGKEGWTMTVWADEDSLHRFVSGDTHSQAIKNGLGAVVKARFVRFTLSKSQLPLSWDDAEKIMDDQGRDLYGSRGK